MTRSITRSDCTTSPAISRLISLSLPACAMDWYDRTTGVRPKNPHTPQW
jgi:hypothetical protein